MSRVAILIERTTVRIATLVKSVRNKEEALEIYFLSYAATNVIVLNKPT
ncbi:hypothetical protein [Escherichia albertii]|nr:hypothetical protein [Escherichia albertii]AHE62010.1 hypothetical protein EAKF1_ch4195 [Escherichia albertii KF1]WMV65029.1 hypothetical protein Q0121_13020 [Escherichia albertii]